MRRKIISEQTINRVIRGVISEMLGEVSSIPYDKNMLDGVDSIEV